MSYLLGVLLLCMVQQALCQVNPIQPPISVLSENPGFIYNNGDGKVRLDVFLETLCSDSSRAWPVLKQVAAYYGPEKLTLAVHQFPLPYHRNAFLCTQGFFQVADKAPEKLFDYMEAVFDDMIFFIGSLTRNNTEFEITSWLAEVAEDSTGIAAKDFADDINGYIGAAIYNWKYATRRGVSGTPWYFVNNVDLGVNPGKFVTLEDWRSFLDPLVNAAQRKGHKTLREEAEVTGTRMNKHNNKTPKFGRYEEQFTENRLIEH